MAFLGAGAAAIGQARSAPEAAPAPPGAAAPAPEPPGISAPPAADACADALRQMRRWQSEHRKRQRHREERLDAARMRQQARFDQMQDALDELSGSVPLLEELVQDVRVRSARQEARRDAEETVPFMFRGTEVWNGRVYALLEHAGRVFAARQRDSRMGWRILSIDRAARQLHVGRGTDERILEEQ